MRIFRTLQKTMETKAMLDRHAIKTNRSAQKNCIPANVQIYRVKTTKSEAIPHLQHRTTSRSPHNRCESFAQSAASPDKQKGQTSPLSHHHASMSRTSYGYRPRSSHTHPVPCLVHQLPSSPAPAQPHARSCPQPVPS